MLFRSRALDLVDVVEGFEKLVEERPFLSLGHVARELHRDPGFDVAAWVVAELAPPAVVEPPVVEVVEVPPVVAPTPPVASVAPPPPPAPPQRYAEGLAWRSRSGRDRFAEISEIVGKQF